MSNEQELREQRDEEAWKHAACLTIAETGEWPVCTDPSVAMHKVYALYKDREMWKQAAKKYRAYEDRNLAMLRTPPDLVPWRMTVWRIGYGLSQVKWFDVATIVALVGLTALLALGLAHWFGWGAVAGVAFGMFVMFVFTYLK